MGVYNDQRVGLAERVDATIKAFKYENTLATIPDSDLILTKYFLENTLYFLTHIDEIFGTALLWRRIYYSYKKDIDQIIYERKIKNHMKRITTLSSCVRVIEEMQEYERIHGPVRHRVKTEEELKKEHIQKLLRDKKYRAQVKRLYKILFRPSKCQNHPECPAVKACPVGALTRKPGNRMPKLNLRKCVYCLECEKACHNSVIMFYVKD